MLFKRVFFSYQDVTGCKSIPLYRVVGCACLCNVRLWFQHASKLGKLFFARSPRHFQETSAKLSRLYLNLSPQHVAAVQGSFTGMLSCPLKLQTKERHETTAYIVAIHYNCIISTSQIKQYILIIMSDNIQQEFLIKSLLKIPKYIITEQNLIL